MITCYQYKQDSFLKIIKVSNLNKPKVTLIILIEFSLKTN